MLRSQVAAGTLLAVAGIGAALLASADAASAASLLRAVDDSATVIAGPSYADGNVLTNDTDASGAPAVAATASNPTGTVVVDTSLIRQPRFGAAYLGADGYFRYTPNTAAGASCPGPARDSFVYQIADAANPLVTSQATVTISWGDTSPAIARADTVDDSAAATVTFDVSRNDCAGTGVPNYGTNYVITAASPPGKGQLIHTFNGTFCYTPNPGATGTDSFSYTVQNPSLGTAATSTATVTILLPAPAKPTPVPSSAPPPTALVVRTLPPLANGLVLANTGPRDIPVLLTVAAVLLVAGVALQLGASTRRRAYTARHGSADERRDA